MDRTLPFAATDPLPENPSNMKAPSFRTLLAGLVLTTSSYGAVSHYLETFPDSTGGNISHGSVGWYTYYDATAINATNNAANETGGGFVLSNINGVGGTGGYGAKANSNPYGLSYTTEFAPLNRSLTEISNISFYSRNASSTDLFRVVIGLDAGGTTQWYASNATYNNTTGGAGFGDSGQLHTLAFTSAASSWRALTFTPGTGLSLAAGTLGADLPVGNLIAAGLFLSGAGGADHAGTMRYDNFNIDVVPEPSALAFGVFGAGLLASRRKRKPLVTGCSLF